MLDQKPTESVDDTPQSARRKQIVLFGILTLLTITATAMLHVNQPEFILDRFVGITEVEYSLFDSILYLSYFIFGLATGALSDRWSRRRDFVLVGTIGSIIFYWLMPTALSYPLLLLYRFLQGAFTVMTWQTLMTMVLDFSGSTNRGKNMGIFGAFLGLAMGLGPAVGGIIASYGVFVPYYTASMLNVVVFVIAFFTVKDSKVAKKKPTLKHSLSVVKRHPKLVVPGLFNFVDRLHIGFILTALPFVLSTVLGLSESLRGLTLAIFAMPFIVLQYPMGKLSDRIGRFKLLIIGSIGFGLVLISIGFIGFQGFSSLLVMLVILGFFAGMTSAPSMALVGDTTGPEDSAMAMGFFNFVGNLGITIGPITFGFLALVSDFVVAFIVAGLLELITLAIIIVLIKFVFKEDLV